MSFVCVYVEMRANLLTHTYTHTHTHTLILWIRGMQEYPSSVNGYFGNQKILFFLSSVNTNEKKDFVMPAFIIEVKNYTYTMGNSFFVCECE